MKTADPCRSRRKVLADINRIMPDALPPEVQTITTTRGVMYELPAKQIGGIRYIAVAAAVLGVGLLGVAAYLVLIRAGLLDWLTGNGQGSGSQPDLFELFWAIPLGFFGLSLLRLAWFLVGGRSTIELRDDRLITTQTLGPLRRRKTYAVKDIKKFQVKTGRPGQGNEAISPAMCALNIVVEDDKVRNITWGYAKPTLTALAEALTEHCEASTYAGGFDDKREAITVEQRAIGDLDSEDKFPDATLDHADIPTRPGDAVARLEYHEDGLTITVPPVGVLKASKGLLGFAVCWNLFMLLFTVMWFVVGDKMPLGGLVLVVGVLTLFWAVGIASMVSVINAGKRMAILDVVGNTLLITRKTLFKTLQTEVQRDNISGIRRDRSGTEVNNVPILNLQVHLHKGKKVAMLSQLSNDELAWIAGELRGALDVPG